MSKIDISISNNVVVVTIDNKYCGTSVIPYEYNNKPESVFVNLVSNCMTKAIEDAKEKMWPKFGDVYYTPTLSDCNLCGRLTYADDSFDRLYKERGLIFKTKEEALEAAKKMLEVVK